MTAITAMADDRPSDVAVREQPPPSKRPWHDLPVRQREWPAIADDVASGEAHRPKEPPPPTPLQLPRCWLISIVHEGLPRALAAPATRCGWLPLQLPTPPPLLLWWWWW